MLMASLQSAAKALGGDIAGGQILAPGPGHSPRDRSLAVKFTADGGFVVHSFAGDDPIACRDHVRARLGLPDWEPGDGQDRTIPERKTRAWDASCLDAQAKDHRRREDDAERIERAQRIWNDAVNPRDTVAEQYLEARALALTDDLAGTVLRFHPRCPWRNESTGQTERIPALIAAFRAIDDDVVTGIHRIRLDQPQRWPKAERKMLGLVHGSAVKLAPLGQRLAIGEGVETRIAAMRFGYTPAWALGSAGGISTFPLFDGVTELFILGEGDQTNRDAATICGQRYHRAGRRVRVVRSRIGSDLNDALMGRR